MKQVEMEGMDLRAVARAYIDEALGLQSRNGHRQDITESEYETAVTDAEEAFRRLLATRANGREVLAPVGSD